MARSESPIVIPQQRKVQLDKSEVLVLRAHLKDWKSVKGKERSRVLLAIHKEASLQAPTKEKAILKARKKIYKQWLQNQSHRKQGPKALIKYGWRWTARKVLIHTHKALIRKETGKMGGSEAMICKWPKATKTVINGLSAEEREEAKEKAERWNNEAAPLDIQAEVAETKGADMIEHFAREMFKTAGMRVCVLSAWKDSKGKLMLGGHDFNEEFGNGESFIKTRDWDSIIMPEWMEYAGDQFGICIGEENIKAAVPWGDVILNQLAFFDSTQWPAGIQFKEPSKMDKADATAVLDFWFTRQENHVQPVFSFKAWKDPDGEMEEAALCPPTSSHGNASKKAKGKGKGKVDSKHNHRAAEESHSEEESDADDGKDACSEGATPSSGHTQEISPPPQSTIPVNKTSHSQEIQTARSWWDVKQAVSDMVHPPTAKGDIDTRQPAESAKKQLKPSASSSGAGKRHKEVTYKSNEPPKSKKRRATDPISDTPAKRTRSKAAAPEASKGKHGKK